MDIGSELLLLVLADGWGVMLACGSILICRCVDYLYFFSTIVLFEFEGTRDRDMSFEMTRDMSVHLSDNVKTGLGLDLFWLLDALVGKA